MKLTKQATQEILDHKLADNEDYLAATKRYIDQYDRRPPGKNVPNRNMLKALRMCTWQNTAEEWARLHITEVYIKTARYKERS